MVLGSGNKIKSLAVVLEHLIEDLVETKRQTYQISTADYPFLKKDISGWVELVLDEWTKVVGGAENVRRACHPIKMENDVSGRFFVVTVRHRNELGGYGDEPLAELDKRGLFSVYRVTRSLVDDSYLHKRGGYYQGRHDIRAHDCD